MSSPCCKEVKVLCTGQKTYDVCVYYQGDLLYNTKLENEECVNLHELLGEIITLLNTLDTSNLGKQCDDIVYEENEDGEITQKEVNLTFEKYICELLSKTDNVDNGSGSNMGFCDLDYGDLLEDPCGKKPQTQCEFNQFILDKLKTL